MIAIAILASGSISVSRYDTAMAMPDEYYGYTAAVSAKDALTQVTAFYEKISQEEIEVPSDLLGGDYSEEDLKAVMIGCVNTSELDEYDEETTITKQELIALLYDALIKYDASYTITPDEADVILNECPDNALVSEENRPAYAFMLKYGVTEKNSVSNPNKEITWTMCADIIDSVYARFNKDIYFYLGDTLVYSGERIENIIAKLGNPVRIDPSEYGFEWYVFGDTAEGFTMIGVENGLTCAFFSNSPDLTFGEFTEGESYEDMTIYSHIDGLTLLTNGDGTFDAVYYNTYEREAVSDEVSEVKAQELLDIINTYRAKHGKKQLVMSSELTEKAEDALSDNDEDALINTGDDIFEIYRQFMASESGCELLYSDSVFNGAIGIYAEVGEDNSITTAVIADPTKASASASANADVELDLTIKTIDNVYATDAPVITSPSSGKKSDDTGELTIELKKSTGTKYLVKLYNSESQQNDINAYIVTDGDTISFPSSILATGIEYTLTVSAVGEEELYTSDEVTFTYGEVTNPVSIITPYDGGITYDDYIELTWDSSSYYNFGIDVYTPEDELIVNTFVTNERTALIQDLDPGVYSLCLTAFKRGSTDPVANTWVSFEIVELEPEITEIFLEENEEYYFTYESYDENGDKYLYFYDEELVSYTGTDGTASYKKKITQKKIKSTHNYEQLFAMEPHPEKTDGTAYIASGTTEEGAAIVSEAMKYLGVPYVWGGSSPSGFDCSGLTSYITKSLGLGSIERTAANQFANSGTFVKKSDLLPGDFVYFQTNGVITHTGIYIGDGMMIHAPHTGEVVKVQSIETNYYRNAYAGAKRIYQ